MSEFLSLPFDGTEARPREITGADRRRFNRDLMGDMIVRAFSFEPTGSGNFSVSGTCLVNGAYADFNNLTIDTSGVQAGQTQVVARIVSDGQGSEDVGIRFVNVAGVNDLRIGTAAIVAGPTVTQITGLGLSPIRIPPGSIVWDRLAPGAVTNTRIADGAVHSRNIPNRHITSGHLADNAVIARTIADNAVSARNIASGTLSQHRFITSINRDLVSIVATSFASVAAPTTGRSSGASGYLNQSTAGVAIPRVGVYRASCSLDLTLVPEPGETPARQVFIGARIADGGTSTDVQLGTGVLMASGSIRFTQISLSGEIVFVTTSPNASVVLIARTSGNSINPVRGIPTLTVETWQP